MLDFTKIDRQEKAYLRGFIYADGNICCDNVKGRYKLNFTISEKDVWHIFKIKEVMESHHKIGKYKYPCNRDPYYTLDIAGKDLVMQLISHGLVPRKSLVLKPPVTVPAYFIPHFIRGCFDGDGSIHITRGGVPVMSVVGTREMMEFINQHFYKFHPHGVNVTKHKMIYAVTYKSTTAVKFMDYIYQDAVLCLNRKKDKCDRVRKTWVSDPQTRIGKRNWSREDVMLLKEIYSISSDKDLIANFPDRSLGGILAKAERLKLKIKS